MNSKLGFQPAPYRRLVRGGRGLLWVPSNHKISFDVCKLIPLLWLHCSHEPHDESGRAILSRILSHLRTSLLSHAVTEMS
jgi:hypothetical protein